MTELTAEQIVDMRIPFDTQISPDGKWIAFTLAPMGKANEHYLAAIWLVPSDGSAEARRFTAGTTHDAVPRWAPDSKSLYFLSDRQKRGTLELYHIPLNGGEAERLIEWKNGVGNFQILRDGKRILFTASDPTTDDDDRRSRERDDADAFGANWRPARLRLYDLESKEITVVEGIGDRHVASFTAAPNGDTVAVFTWPTPELDQSMVDTRLDIIDLSKGESIKHWKLPNGGSGASWNQAGDRLWFFGHAKPAWRAGQVIYEIGLNSRKPTRLGPKLASCPFAISRPNDDHFYTLLAEGLDSTLATIDDKRKFTPLLTFQGTAQWMTVNAKGDRIAMTVSSRNEPLEVWSGPPLGPMKKLTELNTWHREIEWGAQERLSWKAPDDLLIDGLLVLPAGKKQSDGPFPTVTLVHGGPYGRFTDAFNLNWSPSAQWLATSGYAVYLPNPRGGMGHGSEFADTVSQAVGQEDWQDIVTGLDRLIARGIADPDNLAIGGWSQGGFMTAWAVGQTDRFKAGIMGAGVSDWGMMVAESDVMHFEGDLGGSWGWEGTGPHLHDRFSPISYASNVKTPVLILHGANDARVPTSQGRYFARALREHDVPYELVTYPREGHGIQERNHQLDLLKRTREWLQRWIPAGEPNDDEGAKE
jgi:dipeptidyl aminopeptidase/acylaminoacyl peptidase